MSDLLLADLHLSPHPRDRYRLEFLDRLPKLAKQHGADSIYILGDLTDAKDGHGAWLVNQVVDHMSALAQSVYLVFLMGNHDHDKDDPFFRFLHNIENIEFVYLPTFIGERLLLPHTSNYRRDWELDFSGAKRIYAHSTFDGARNEVGQELHGRIPLSALPRIPIFSGDVHVPQGWDNVIYIGAPYTVRFGDDFEPRAVLVNEHGWKSIPLSGPQKRLLHVDRQDNCTGKANRGDIVRINLELSSADYAQWDRIRTYWQEFCDEHGYILDSIRPQLMVERGAVTAPKQVKTRSDKELVYDYCGRHSVDKPTQELGLELL